jgi:hypothetical protein
MSTQEKPSPDMREAVVPTHPPMPPLPPSVVPHWSPTGIIEEREVRGWPWFWRKRTIPCSQAQRRRPSTGPGSVAQDSPR